MNVLSVFDDFLNLFYPKICLSCGAPLVKNETIICTKCDFNLPRTNMHIEKGNKVEKIFYGRVNIEMAMAFLYYNKKTNIQNLLHSFKYKGKSEIGIALGKRMGIQLNQSEFFSKIDVIIPIPLHKEKLKKRGYNQSEIIAQGIQETFAKKIITNNLIRTTYTQTQTKKTRTERWENVEKVFVVSKPEDLKNKHILLIDDVVTTGATLEACASKILEIQNTKVSVATLAVAN